MHKTNRRFRDCLNALPRDVQDSARKSFALLKKDPRHPSLRFKKVGELWSMRISRRYRALAVKRNHGFLWFWVGGHDEYEKAIKKH